MKCSFSVESMVEHYELMNERECLFRLVFKFILYNSGTSFLLFVLNGACFTSRSTNIC